MAFSADDLARSIRRTLQMVIPAGPPPDWTYRLERRQVADDSRPVGVVLLGDAGVVQARASLDQGNVVTQWPVTVYMYPRVGEDERAARRDADELRETLRAIVLRGIVGEDALTSEAGALMSGPLRLPLWDWDGVDPDADDAPLPAHAHAVAAIDRASIALKNLGDPEDDKRRSVVLDMRCTIESPGRTNQTGPPVSGVSGRFAGE